MSTYFTLLSVLYFSYSAVFAQLTINSSGHTTIGGNTTINGLTALGSSPSSSYKLRVNYSANQSIQSAIYSNITNSGGGVLISYGIQSRSVASCFTNYGIYGYASGGQTNWAGYFAGNVYTTGSYQSSDERFKKNICILNNTDILQKISELEPVRFEFLDEAELKEADLPSLNSEPGYHFGLLAQKVEEIFPELVIDVANPPDEEKELEDGDIVMTKAINYQELTVVLLAAVQKLKAEVDELKTKLKEKE